MQEQYHALMKQRQHKKDHALSMLVEWHTYHEDMIQTHTPSSSESTKYSMYSVQHHD